MEQVFGREGACKRSLCKLMFQVLPCRGISSAEEDKPPQSHFFWGIFFGKKKGTTADILGVTPTLINRRVQTWKKTDGEWSYSASGKREAYLDDEGYATLYATYYERETEKKL